MIGERVEEFQTRYSDKLYTNREVLRTLCRDYNKSHTLMSNKGYFIMINNVRGGKKLVLNNRDTRVMIALTGKAELIQIEQVNNEEFDVVIQYQEHLSYIQEIISERESLEKIFDSTEILLGIVDFLEIYASEVCIPVN